MKKIFFGILAMAAFAACSNEEQIAAPQGEAIAFGNAFVDNSVRAGEAVDPSYAPDGITQFNVYGSVNGVNIFNGNLVEKNSAAYGAAWTLTGAEQYWINGGSYIFDAVVDGTPVSLDAAGLPTALSYDVTTQKDILHTRVETVGKPTTNNGIVTFTFSHLLSKVKFTVENKTAAAATNYRYTVTDIKLTNVNTKGDCAVPNHEWSNLTEAGEYAIANMVVPSNSTVECANEVLLIPSTDDTDAQKVGISFKLNIEMSDGRVDGEGALIWTTIPTTDAQKTYTEVMTLEAGKAYNFKATVSLGDKIQFTATEMNDWANGNTKDSDDDDTVNDYVPVN